MTEKKKHVLLLLALAVCAAAAGLFLLLPKTGILPEKTAMVSAVYSCGDDGESRIEIPPEAAQELAEAVNRHRASPFPIGLDDPSRLSECVMLTAADGSFCTVHYQYYSGFSFLHGKEDDYRTIVTVFDAEGKARKAWRMEEDFDEVFTDWRNPCIFTKSSLTGGISG